MGYAYTSKPSARYGKLVNVLTNDSYHLLGSIYIFQYLFTPL